MRLRSENEASRAQFYDALLGEVAQLPGEISILFAKVEARLALLTLDQFR